MLKILSFQNWGFVFGIWILEFCGRNFGFGDFRFEALGLVFEDWCFWLKIISLYFSISVLGLGIEVGFWNLGFAILELGIFSLGFWVWGLEFGVWGLEFLSLGF